MRQAALFFGLVLLFTIPGLPAAGQSVPQNAAPAAAPVIVHTPPASYKAGEKLHLTAVPPQDASSMTFYYRTAGAADFQARPMAKSAPGEYAFEFETAVLAAPQFEYYLEAEIKGDRIRLPAGAPAQTFAVAAAGGDAPPAVPQNLPSPQAEESKFPLHSNGSLQHSFSPAAAAPAPVPETTTDATRQIGQEIDAGAADILDVRLYVPRSAPSANFAERQHPDRFRLPARVRIRHDDQRQFQLDRHAAPGRPTRRLDQHERSHFSGRPHPARQHGRSCGGPGQSRETLGACANAQLE